MSEFTRFQQITSSPEFINGSAEYRINTLLSIATPNDVHLLSQFMGENVKLSKFIRTSSASSTALFTFKVEKFYCNFSGTLHGGAQATIYDVLTSIMLQAVGNSKFWGNAGVSRSLNVTYLRPAPEGIMVECEVDVVHSGKSLSLLKGAMRRQDDGKLISTCEHDKAAIPIKAGFDVPGKL